EELVTTLRAAWTGEPFTFRGRTVQVTPTPHQPGGPSISLGGSSQPAARPAARLGCHFSPSSAPGWGFYPDRGLPLGQPPPRPPPPRTRRATRPSPIPPPTSTGEGTGSRRPPCRRRRRRGSGGPPPASAASAAGTRRPPTPTRCVPPVSTGSSRPTTWSPS